MWEEEKETGKEMRKAGMKAPNGVIRIEMFDDSNGPLRDSVMWVSKNIGILDSKKLSGPPPAREAVALLNWVNESASNEAEFWTKIWPKLIPAKLKDEAEGYEDDGREYIALIERIERAHGGIRTFLSPGPEIPH